MYEKVTQAKEKAKRAMKTDRRNVTIRILSLTMVLMVVFSGIGPLALLSPIEPTKAASEKTSINEKWSIDIGGQSSDIAVGNDYVYVILDRATVAAYDKTDGSHVWNITSLGDPRDVEFSEKHNLLYIQNYNDAYYAYSPAKVQQWSVSVDAEWYGGIDMAIDNLGYMYYEDISGNTRVIDETGSQVDSHPNDLQHEATATQKNGWHVITRTDAIKEIIFTRDYGDNKLAKRTYDPAKDVIHFGGNNTVYTHGGGLEKVDWDTNNTVWTYSTPSKVDNAKADVKENRTYFEYGSTLGILSEDGTLVTNHTLSQSIRHFTADVKTDSMYATTSDDKLHRLDTTTIETELDLDITDYQEPNTTKEYRVYYTENGERTNVTKNATVTSGNTSIISIDSTNLTMTSETVNATVNVTAEYDGLSDTVEVTVAEVDMNYIGILPPAYWITSIIVDPTMQWLFVAIVIGAVAGQMSRNKWAGMGTIQTVILIGWAIDLVDDGILMAAIAFLIFAGLITMQGSSQAEPIE